MVVAVTRARDAFSLLDTTARDTITAYPKLAMIDLGAPQKLQTDSTTLEIKGIGDIVVQAVHFLQIVVNYYKHNYVSHKTLSVSLYYHKNR